MLMGPVFRAELLRTSRKRHYYVQRVVYGVVLLMVLWFNYEGLLVISRFRSGGKPTIAGFAEFALNTIIWFAGVQLVTLLLLVPTLFGGVSADEKQRKTIHHLMASRLSSGAIVLDKLAARWVHVAVFILPRLPVVSLLTLFGGVAWDYVIGAYAGTFSIVFFTAALAVLMSTFARRVGQGVLIAYLLEIIWLVGPPIFDAALSLAVSWLLSVNFTAQHVGVGDYPGVSLGLVCTAVSANVRFARPTSSYFLGPVHVDDGPAVRARCDLSAHCGGSSARCSVGKRKAAGDLASLAAQTTGRALMITIATLLFLNVGYFGIAYPIAWVFWSPVPPVVSECLSSGFTPRLTSAGLLSYRHVAHILEMLHGADIPRDFALRAVAYGALALVSYLAPTVILFWRSLRRFEQLVDRPRRADGLPIESMTGGLKLRTAVTATRRTSPAKPG